MSDQSAVAPCRRCGNSIVDRGGLPCPQCGENRLVRSEKQGDPPSELDRETEPKVEQALRRFEEELELLTPRVRVTPVIIGINVTVFVLMIATGVGFSSPTREELVRWGANLGEATISGQPWRLLSSMFVHIGIM